MVSIKSKSYINVTYITVVVVLILCIKSIHADDRKSATELIRSRGFNVEEHDVISQNYVLKVYHIINPLADPKTLHKIPVMASHGISFDITNMFASSKNSRPRKPKLAERVTLYAMENGTDDRNLHFYLANNNYDVWLIEARATNDRVLHRLPGFKENNKSFWDFSLDEQALIDLPLQIDFILKKTGSPKGSYIAYSQSTALMFALLSMRPEYSEKLTTFIALAPVVYTTHVKGVIWPLTYGKLYLRSSSAIPMLPNWVRKFSNYMITYFCSVSFIKYTICRKAWQEFSGKDKEAELDGGMVENVLKSTSIKSFEQFGQNALANDFRMYDYKDELRNMEEYGQTVPPQYNISKINLRTICLFRGNADKLSTPEDQMTILSRLRVPIYEDHIMEDYAHIDFVVSPTVVRDINEPILRILDKITNRPVKKVSHTLGNPNPQVQGTQLVIDLEKHSNQKDKPKDSEIANTHRIFTSQPEAERPTDGVESMAKTTSVHEQMHSRALEEQKLAVNKV